MSDLVESIKQSVKEHSYPIVHGINNHDIGMTVTGFCQVLDEELAKEPDAYEWRFVGSVKLQNRIMSGGNCSYCGKMAYWFATDNIPKYCPCCGRKIKAVE